MEAAEYGRAKMILAVGVVMFAIGQSLLFVVVAPLARGSWPDRAAVRCGIHPRQYRFWWLARRFGGAKVIESAENPFSAWAWREGPWGSC